MDYWWESQNFIVNQFRRKEKGTYKHSLRDFHTLCQKPLALNNAKYIFPKVIKVAPLDQEVVK